MKIYLLRHGKQKAKNKGYISIQSHLSQEGIKETNKLLGQNVLPQPDKIYSSHFARAQESAKIIAEHFGVSITTKQCLGEWKIQELNIQFEKFLEEEKKARKDIKLAVTGGESFAMLQERIYNCILEICKENPNANDIIIVSHGNALYTLFKKLLNQRLLFDEKTEQIRTMDYGIVEYSNNKLKVVKNIITRPSKNFT